MPLLDRLAHAFPSLRHRNFRLFLGGQFVSLCGTWMEVVALGWLVLQLTNSPFMVGLVSTLGSLPILLLTLYGGVLADRVRKRPALLLLQSLMLLEALALGILTATHHITVPWVMVLALFGGVLSAFEVPIRQAFVIEMVGRDHLMNAIALNSSNFNLTRIVGPAIAGGLIAGFGIAGCFFANAASFLGAILSLSLMAETPNPVRRDRGDLRPAFREGLRHSLGKPEPRALLLLTAIFSIFGFSFVPMLPVFAREVLHTGAAGYGGLMSSVGIGATLGALTVAAFGHRAPPGRLIMTGGYVFGLSLTLLGVTGRYWVATLLLAVAGCAMILNNITTNSLLQTRAPDHLRGRVVGFYALVVLGMAPFGSLQAGWVAEHLGVSLALALGGAACIGGMLLPTTRISE